jgi:surfactin synthase thioesterase subunit
MFGDAKKVLKKKTKLLEVLQQQESEENMAAIQALKGEIDFILEQEDIKWKQCAKQSWYQ